MLKASRLNSFVYATVRYPHLDALCRAGNASHLPFPSCQPERELKLKMGNLMQKIIK